MTTEQEQQTLHDENPAELAERASELLRGDDVEAARSLIDDLHPADQADLYDRLEEPERATMLALLSAEGVAHVLEHMDEDLMLEVVDEMPRATLAKVLDQTDNDVVADILRQLAPAEAVAVLSGMSTASEIAPLLGHSDESAGGIMTRSYVPLHKDMTAGQAINFLRVSRPLAEEAYYLYVLDGQNRLQGTVSLRELVVADPMTRIEDIMERDIASVRPDTDQEEAARELQHYRLRAIPVVDENGVLTGIITADDIIDVIEEEATEDMFQIVGLPGDESVYAPLWESTRRRLPWLFINLIAAFVAAAMVAIFEGTIEKAAALAVFMPIVAGQGGNAGIQTITIVVRGIAVGEIEMRDAKLILWKEIAIGLVKGLAIGLVVGAVAWIWQDNWTWGLVVFLAILGNMLVAGAVGALIPLGLRSLKLDPAVASGIFLTMITDMMGFLLLLGLATLMIDQLT